MADPNAQPPPAAVPQRKEYKLKPPQEGIEKDELSLTMWLPLMEDWLKLENYWDMIQLADGHAYTPEETSKDLRVKLILWNHLSKTRRVLVSQCSHSNQMWRKLVQVNIVRFYGSACVTNVGPVASFTSLLEAL
jgi:hypothetical protein